MGLDNIKGEIMIGKHADIVIINPFNAKTYDEF